MATSPDLLIRDVVFPIALFSRAADGSLSMDEFLGTGFLVGSRGFALTAAHVVDIKPGPFQAIGGMFANRSTNHWHVWNADICDVHPAQDVALLKMRGDSWPESPFKVTFDRQYSAMPYMLFGYPQANLYEKVDDLAPDGTVRGRPDMIYSAGHIRRRLSHALPSNRGTSFYELSQPVGRGCSGSPVIRNLNGSWKVVGIYVADQMLSVAYETLNDQLDKCLRFLDMPGTLGYAATFDSLADWKPSGLVTDLREA